MMVCCDCESYVLPPLVVDWHEVPTPPGVYATPDRDGQGRLVSDASLGVSAAAAVKHQTLTDRLKVLLGIVDEHASRNPWDQIIIWVDLNEEQRAVESELKARGLSYSSLHGTLSTEECEERLEAWRRGDTYALILKPVQFGEGVNLQQCSTAVFLGIGFKFADIFQALHRIRRFGQTRTCHVHFVYAEAERSVKAVLERKWAQHEETAARMAAIIAEHGLSHSSLSEALGRSLGVERVAVGGARWMLACNDTVAEAKLIGDDEVGLIVTSIPFGNLYEYSTAVEDFGHSDSPEEFWAQMDYLTPELLRMLAPGRVYACHVKDRIVFGNMTGAGYSTVYPFHCEAIMHTMRHGFDFLGQITVVTDVVRENNQSYRLGWSEQCRDGTRMGCGTPEYILLFRKPQSDRSRGYADIPVVKSKDEYSRSRWQVDAHGFWRDSGDRLLRAEEFDDLSSGERARLFDEWTRTHVYDYELHVAIGERIDAKGQLPATFMLLAPASHHPDVWVEAEVVRMRTLNTEQARRGLNQHVCPMPLTLVDRLIRRFSAEGDLVYDPFAGIGTTLVRALAAERRARGVELARAYWVDAVEYCRAQEAKAAIPTLFDLLEPV